MKKEENHPQVYKYSIDNKPKETPNQFITGAEIRQAGNVPADYSIFLKVNGPGDDELIEDNQKVDLSVPGRDHFYSSKRNTNNG
jgi:hypothetical protein